VAVGGIAPERLAGGHPVRVDIISAGPSAKLAKPHGYVLAVNRAACVVECDAIVAGDFRTLRDIDKRRTLWTMKNEDALPPGWPTVKRFDLLPGWTDLKRPCNWSVQGAIAVAVHMGASDIWMHGLDAYFRNPDSPADCSGYDGADGRADRNRDRWIREREDLDLSIAWAQAKGVTVTITVGTP
jgi:hypothetical protein